MRKLLTILFLSIVSITNAQIDTISLPPELIAINPKKFLRVSPDDHIWVSVLHKGIGEYDGANWFLLNDTTGLSSNNVTSIAFDNQIRWIGTEDGLMKKAGINLLSYRTNNSPMPSNNILSLYQGDTSLWIGTDHGVVSMSNTFWVNYDMSNSPIFSDSILEINSTPFGVYFVTPNGISIKTSNGWSATSPNIGMVDRFTKKQNGDLFWKNYVLHDSVFHEVNAHVDICLFGSLSNQTFFIGEPVSNKIYSVDNGNFSLLELDTAFNAIGYVYNFFISTNQPELFDFDPNGKLVSLDNVNPIYRADLSSMINMQPLNDCYTLDINQVNARIFNYGVNFSLNNYPGLYEVPKGSGKSSIYAEGQWFGGKDASNIIHVAAEDYSSLGIDFWTGPLDTTDATIDLTTSQQYDSVWKINKYVVDYFISKFLDGSVANGSYTIPSIILNWPVSGTGNITRNLAPWIDYNGDGVYNPYDGDYPDVKGDQMLWWIFNDNLGVHRRSDSARALGIEVHAMAYAYNCPSLVNADSVINYTTFYHYDIYNRSDTSYHDFYNGVFTNMDLGNYADDYTGCDTSLDMASVYNGDNDDAVYGLNPPMINIAYLDGAIPNPGDGIDNDHDGIIDEPGEKCMMSNFIIYDSGMGTQDLAQDGTQFYNYMTGHWAYGEPLEYGGDGLYFGNNDSVHYIFPGDPFDTLQWSDPHPGNGYSSQPTERAGIISSGPYDLPAHGKQSFDYAYVFTRDPNNPNGPNSFALNRDQVARIKHFFETDSFPCQHLIGVDEIKNNISLNVYPNPTHSNVHVTVGNVSGKINYELRNLLGEIIFHSKTESNSFDLNLNNYSPGVYFLVVKTKSGNSNKKLVIN